MNSDSTKILASLLLRGFYFRVRLFSELFQNYYFFGCIVEFLTVKLYDERYIGIV